MKLHFQQAFRAFILLTFSVLLFKLHYIGDISKFINPKYEVLSQLASIIFLILFFIQTTRIWSSHHHHHCHQDDQHCHHDHGNSPFNTKKLISYLVIIFPLGTGLFLPPKVLDASIADKKGAMLILSNQSQNQESVNQKDSMDELPDKPNLSEGQKEMSEEEYNQLIKQLEQKEIIEMNDSVYAAFYDEISMDVEKFIGKKIKIKGFVYKEDGLSPNRLVISRFLITHCVADASIIGFLTEFSKIPTLDTDTWIEAEGVLDVTSYNGAELPLIKITGWKKINEPKTPYVYPISVRII
jgi:putative membrane protein